MRVESGKRKRMPNELNFSEILLMAKYCSYNFASRYFNVTLEALKKYMESNYPEMHQQILANGVRAKTTPFYQLKKDFEKHAK